MSLLDRLRKVAPDPLAPPDTFDPGAVAAMLREIGIALVEVSQPTQVVEERLRRIAPRYTTEPVRAAVLPTMLLIQVGTEGYEIDSTNVSSSRLDMAARIDRIAELAEAGAISPADAVEKVRAARTSAPRFGWPATVLGYAITTVGFGMIVEPTWSALPAHLFLGVVVGLIVALARPFPALTPILPTLSAVVVTLLAIWFVADVSNVGLLRVISPSLVATLPGMALTIGAIELASTQIISGASRVVYGIAQLGLLVYGVVVGIRIAGVPPSPGPSAALGSWSAYASIVVIAVGLYLYLSAPRGSLGWLLVTIAVAVLTQDLAGQVMTSGHSGFIGAIVAIPFAILASRFRGAPPAMVLMLAAFWSLVPGQLSFMSVSRSATGDYTDISSVGVAAAAVTSIALGTLVAWSLVRTIDNRLARSAATPVR